MDKKILQIHTGNFSNFEGGKSLGKSHLNKKPSLIKLYPQYTKTYKLQLCIPPYTLGFSDPKIPTAKPPQPNTI